jgi:hypothetical protein
MTRWSASSLRKGTPPTMRKTPRGLNIPRSRSAPPEAPATDAEDVVHAPVEEANKAARGPTGGDTDDVVHVVELEAALLAVSSPAHETHPEGAGDAETEPPPAADAEAEV